MNTRDMKSIQLSIFFLLVWFIPLDSISQNKAGRVNINVTAEVQSAIELVTISDIQLGSVQPGQFEVFVQPSRDPGAGSMIARGRPNAEIRITYDEKQVLRRAGGKEILTFYYQVVGHDEDNQFAAELVDGYSRHMAFNANGEFFLWIGGYTSIENAVRGQYEGEFTIEVEYI